MVKVFIFDLDGTLIDSHEAHIKSFKKPLNKRGFFTNRKELKKYFGLQEEDILKKVFPKITNKVINEVMKEKRKLFIDNVRLVKKKRCAERLLKYLNSIGIVALATGCHNSEVNAILEYFNWIKYFKKVITGYEVQRPKPAPDIILELIKYLGVKKKDCVFIGDTVYDAIACQAARIKFIGVDDDPEIIEKFKALGIKDTYKNLCSISSSLLKLP